MQRVLVVPWSIAATNLAATAQAFFWIRFPAGVARAASPFAVGAVAEGASDSSCPFAALRSRSASSLRVGYCGSMSISVCAITAAAAMRANHLRSAGITYQGANAVLV